MPDRFIRESALTSESLAQLSDFAERLFWRLTTVADDFGRFVANPAVIQGRTMPLVAGVNPKKIFAALQELDGAGAVKLYEAEGRKYGYFPSWEKHQVRRARTSKHPAPGDCTAPKEHALPLESDIEDLLFNAITAGTLVLGPGQIAERQVRRGENYFDIIVRSSNATFIFELKRGRLSNKAIAQLRRYLDAVPESVGLLVGNGLTADFDFSACRDDISVITYNDSLEWTLERSGEHLPANIIDQFPSVISRDFTLNNVCSPPNTNTGSHTYSNPNLISSSSDQELNPLDPNCSPSTAEPKLKPKRETTWPDNLSLTEPMREVAVKAGINPEAEFEAWRDDCAAHGRKYIDWPAAWRTRIRNAPKFAGGAKLALTDPRAGPAPLRLTANNAHLMKRIAEFQAEEARDEALGNKPDTTTNQGTLAGSIDGRPDGSGMVRSVGPNRPEVRVGSDSQSRPPRDGTPFGCAGLSRSG